MKARFISAGDILIYKGKPALVKKVKIVSGKIQVETTQGHLTFNPENEVEVE